VLGQLVLALHNFQSSLARRLLPRELSVHRASLLLGGIAVGSRANRCCCWLDLHVMVVELDADAPSKPCKRGIPASLGSHSCLGGITIIHKRARLSPVPLSVLAQS
jgi:hypothetical protein